MNNIRAEGLLDKDRGWRKLVGLGPHPARCDEDRDGRPALRDLARGLVIAENVKISTTLSFLCLEARTQDPTILVALDAIWRAWG
ncbi:hypothetical protein WMC41_29635 (plasmid) [Shinella yambaruensis]|uniref:hypothetical protein n=1 Tax=Shinella yambaruensis TaxID=415996 RepID=UPI003D7A91D1